MHAHLDALNVRLSNERARLASAKTPKEVEARKVTVAQVEKEIEGELKFLGLTVETASDLSDDELLDLLGN